MIAIRTAFRRVIPEDVLEISDAGNVKPGAIFLVTYYVKPGKKLYYLDEEASLNPAVRSYYPEINTAWQCEISVPNKPEHYKFSFDSDPSNFKYRGDLSGEARKSALYDDMIASAFDNFGFELVKTLGLAANDEAKPPAKPMTQ